MDVTYWACQRQSERKCVPIGRPVANTQTYILDARLQPVPVGVPGELHLGGVQIGRGYHNRPELTREKFIADPFRHEPGARLYRTGDLCRHLADGAIEYLGRLDHQVKIRGFRIELGEIEAVIAQHPNVKEVVVVAREETPGNKRLVAYVGATGTAPAVGELRSHLKERLPDYMVPAAFVFLEKFPLTANGKVDRKALPAPETARVETAATYEAPRTATEIALAAIWCDVLRLPQVGRHDNFFELGGHSLLALRILARAREIVGVEVTLRTLFEQPTVAGLAKQVEIVRPWHRPPDSQAEAVPAGHEAGEI